MLLHPAGAEPATLLHDADTPEAGFERLASFAARLLHTPVSVLSLVDRERPFSAGDPTDLWRPRREAPLARSLCGVALTSGLPLLLEDAREHPVVRRNPQVWLGEVGYAGIPFRRPDGQVAGTLCVADTRPRSWTPEEVDLLSSLARFAEVGGTPRFTALVPPQRAKSSQVRHEFYLDSVEVMSWNPSSGSWAAMALSRLGLVAGPGASSTRGREPLAGAATSTRSIPCRSG